MRKVGHWLAPPKAKHPLTETEIALGVYAGKDAKGQTHIIYGEETRQHLNDLTDPSQR